MMNAAIIGMGVWGQNLVPSVHHNSAAIRLAVGATRTPAWVLGFAEQYDIRMIVSY